MTALGARIFSVILLATCVAAADDAEFAFNLLSDVAPVLALFGESFATQFMSESLSIFDHIIFAMVPLGIIAAITGAIRVQGRSVAKAFIGRARENRALAELELMSSTSGEVCELFNGTSIVRVMGKPKVAQFIILPEDYEKLEKEYDTIDTDSSNIPQGSEIDRSCGIHSLLSASREEARKNLLMECKVFQTDSSLFLQQKLKLAQKVLQHPFDTLKKIIRVAPKLQADEETLQETDPSKIKDNGKIHDHERKERPKTAVDPAAKSQALQCPPNLQLNLSSDHFHEGAFINRYDILVAAIVATLLQMSLIAIAAAVAFRVSPDSSSLFESSVYGFPCYVAGSIMLSIGTGLCSYIVERSTFEFSWEISKKRSPMVNTLDKAPRLLWVQAKQEVSDQAFDGYIISAGPKRRIVTSSRKYDTNKGNVNTNERKRPSNNMKDNISSTNDNANDSGDEIWAVFTVVAAFLAGVGFTGQFMGLRGLAFPCSIAHLVAIFVMALIRSVVRRRLGRVRDFCPAFPGHELDFLAMQIVFYPDTRKFDGLMQGNQIYRSKPCAEKFFRWKLITPNSRELDSSLSSVKEDPVDDMQIASNPRSYSELSGEKSSSANDTGAPTFKKATSQQLLRVRERLGNLSKWPSRSLGSAVSLARSIECVMDAFFPHSKDGVMSLEWRPKATRLTCPGSPEEQDHCRILVERGKDGKWKTEVGMIDAALSLWMATIDVKHSDTLNVKKEPRPEPRHARKQGPSASSTHSASQQASDWRRAKPGDSLTYTFYRIIGDSTQNKTLKRDISWWVDHLVAEQSESEGYRGDAEIVIGSNGTDEDSVHELGIISKASLPTILAQHLFTSFIWTMVQFESFPKDCLNLRDDEMHEQVEIDPPHAFNALDLDQNWLRLKLRHRLLTKMVREMESYGLGSTHDILLCIIPAFSSMRLLPNQAIQKLVPSVGPRQDWTETAACYTTLLRKIEPYVEDDEDSSGIRSIKGIARDEDKLNVVIVTATMDFLSLAYEPYSEQQFKPQQDLYKDLEDLVVKLNSSGFATIMQKLAPVYRQQCRQEIFKNIFNQFGQEKETSQFLGAFGDDLDEAFARSTLGFTPYHFLIVHYPEYPLFELDTTRGSDQYRFMKQEKSSLRADVFGWTPWHYACLMRSSQFRFLVRYLEKKHNQLPGLLDNLQRSPIHIAALEGMKENLKLMFDDLTERTKRSIIQAGGLDGMTPLHLSSRNGNTAFLDLIPAQFRTREFLEAKDLWGRQALHLATRCGQNDVAIKLIEMGSRPDQLDDMGKSSIDYFSERWDWEWKNRQGATARGKNDNVDVDASSPGESMLKSHYMNQKDSEMFLKFSMKSPGHLYSHGRTFLHIAIGIVNEESVYALLRTKFEIEAPDDEGRTPLHYAILAGRESLAEGLIKGIPTIGKIVFADPSAKDSRNTTPLMFAARKNLMDVAKALLHCGKGGDINDKNKDGKTALHHASSVEMVQLLVENKCDFLGRDSAGMTVLHTAIDDQKSAIALCLLDIENDSQKYETPFNGEKQSLLLTACKHGLSEVVPKLVGIWPTIVNTGDERFGQPPLSWACENDHSETVEQLLSCKDVDVNQTATRYMNYTPLHFAIKSEGFEILDLLLKVPSVNLHPESEYGDTPLQMAIENNLTGVAQRLMLHDRTSTQQRAHYVKSFAFNASEEFHQLTSDVLQSITDESLICGLLVWLVCDGKPPRRNQEVVTNRHISSLLTPMAKVLGSGGWKQLQDPYDLITFFHEAGTRNTLIEQRVDSDGLDQDNWSYLDYINRLDSKETLMKAFRTAHRVHDNKKDGYKQPKALVLPLDQKNIRVNSCKDQHHKPDDCPGVHDIAVVQESSDNREICIELCIRSNHSIPPDRDDFYFEMKILEDSESKIVAIGFCGPGDNTNQMPGWFPGSWGYHGDDGKVYVESGRGGVPSSDFGDAGMFSSGDTVGAYLNVKTGRIACTRNGKLLNMGYDLEDPDGKFRFGKLYPCIGIDVGKGGVGMRCKVNFDGSVNHPFLCDYPRVFQKDGKNVS